MIKNKLMIGTLLKYPGSKILLSSAGRKNNYKGGSVGESTSKEIVSRCSSSIMRESMGSSVNKTGVIAMDKRDLRWTIRNHNGASFPQNSQAVYGHVLGLWRTSSNTRNQATVQDGRVVVQNVQGRQNRDQGNNAWGGGAAGYGGAQNRVRNANPGQARQIKCYNCNGGQDNAIDEDVDEQPVQDLALNVDNVFQPDDCDAFDSDVDEAPTAQTMFMANLSSADPVYDEAGPSYDSDILSEVHDHDHYQDVVCEHHEEHEMHDDVQPTYVVDSHADYTSDSNMIPYVKDNAVPVVQSNVSSVPNDTYMMIFNDMHEPHAQSVSDTTRNTVVDNSLTAKLATYKEQVELYERRARFELTEREQKIDEQLRIVITDRNIKEENLKKELHSVKMQLASTINHNKSMVEEVTSLKKDFKQKENKN
ncbi:hypothetical protein Tco_0573443 [Tanacetum coccineum]